MSAFSEYLKNRVAATQTFLTLQEELKNAACVEIKSAEGALASILVSLLFEQRKTSLLLICQDDVRAESVKEDLIALAGEDLVAYFPLSEFFPHRKLASDNISQSYRMDTIERLSELQKLVVVTSAQAVARLLPDIEKIKLRRRAIKIGLALKFDEFLHDLIKMGYLRQPIVERMGEMSVRGGLMDVFPFSRENPIRIEFWGDQIESIREFDVETQRSLKPIPELSLYPIQREENHQNSVGRKKYQYTKEASLLNLFPKETLIILQQPELIYTQVQQSHAELEKLYHLGQSDFDLEKDRRSPHLSADELRALVNEFQNLNLISVKSGKHPLVQFSSTQQPALQGNLKLLNSSVRELFEEKKSVNSDPIYFLCDYHDQAERMKEMFEDRHFPENLLQVEVCGLHEGFYLREAGLVVFTDHQFYGRQRRLRAGKQFKKGLNFNQLKMLRSGDFVVHDDFGIGIYKGLKRIKVGENERECIQIAYQDNDIVYVPLDRMMRVQKYSAREGVQPQINKLGGADWERLKLKTKKKIKDIAQDLIAIYAARKAQNGYAFSKDSLWQKELEASFPYEDTPDQSLATITIKKDMESTKPMDRLICGDVGFGKTELAVRAAFKAVNDNKQVAVLVPTTILAQQHFRTFKERLAQFPVKVDVLSRFRTPAEQQKIIESVGNGTIDVIIGTHKLFSKALKFKDLSLLIIDEEQRFGVKQKERLKEINNTVDVLTMTATPIPRTLHMSLLGARDMSNINTAPKERLPILTEVAEFDQDLIREAILREMQRGGQVFFVYNRVKTIEAAAAMVKRIVPEARVAVAHGQMNEHSLERIMLQFLDKRFDVLVCTTIIENGLDIPNVNTIILHRADRYGLSELYQLRGRVGRTNQRAFAYLLIPPVSKMNSIALKRVQTIEEFTNLGAGFQIALRDLEIRGAGNLLGAEQSGFIAALGFELYCKILDDAVNEITGKAESVKSQFLIEPTEVQVNVNFDIFIPNTYIDRSDLRLDYYRRLVSALKTEDIQSIQEELRDRFGKYPEEVSNLFHILIIKLVCAQLGIAKILLEKQKFIAEFIPQIYELKQKNFKEWAANLVKDSLMTFEFIPQDTLKIRLHLRDTQEQSLEFIKKFMQSLL
jgi:transcription-repair coupling factor (superfamily II helicase)